MNFNDSDYSPDVLEADKNSLLSEGILKFRSKYERILINIRNEIEDESKKSIHLLNDDCLKHILGYVTPYHLLRTGIFVCKRWFIICTEMLFSIGTLILCDKVIPWSPKEKASFYTLHSSRLYFALNFSQEVIFKLIMSGPDANDRDTEVKPQFPRLSYTTLPAISVFCPNLTVLEISRFHLHDLPPNVLPESLCELTVCCCDLMEEDLNNILCGLCSLVRLDVSKNKKITGESIISNLQKNQMRSIRAESCTSLDPSVIAFIFHKYQKSLEELDFSSVQIGLFNVLINSPEPKPELSVVRLFKVSDKCYNDFLRDARGTIVSTYDRRILLVLQQMPALESLHIKTVPFWGFRNSSHVSLADYLDNLADILPNLRELNLTRCPKNPQCLAKLKGLRELALDISSGYICNDRYMNLLGESLANCPALEILHVTLVERPTLRYHPFSATLVYRLIFDYLISNPLLRTMVVNVQLVTNQSSGTINLNRKDISRSLRSRNSPLTVIFRNSALNTEDFIDIPSCVSIVFQS